jgi:zinc protease
MNKFVWCLLFLTACMTARKEPVVEGVTNLKRSSNHHLRPFTEHTLSNGLRVLLIKDDSLPSVGYHMVIKNGSSSDPAQKSGLTLLTASLLEKGTLSKSATQLADDLALIGGSFQSNVDNDYIYLVSTGLSMHRDELMNLFIEIVTKPSFADAEVERMRKQILTALIQTVDNPQGLAGLAFNEYLFGTHPYGRSPMGNKKDVKAIKRTMLIRHYIQYFRPNNAILAVVGNYAPDILQKLETNFRSWKSRNVKPLGPEILTPVSKLEMRLVNKSDLTQAQIRVGQEGITRNHKDFQALRLANMILGQGFSSRLVDEVRDNLGLTYHISSEIDAQLQAGSIEINTFTRNEKVGEALTKILAILDKFVKDGVEPSEVEAAKGQTIGNFGRSVATADKLAYNLLVLRAYGIPDSYLTEFEDTVESLRVAEINRVIRTHLHPDKLKVLVLANQAQVMPQLSSFQPIEVKQAADIQ